MRIRRTVGYTIFGAGTASLFVGLTLPFFSNDPEYKIKYEHRPEPVFAYLVGCGSLAITAGGIIAGIYNDRKDD